MSAAAKPEPLDPHLVDLDRPVRAASFGRGGYRGARFDLTELKEWRPPLGSSDSDSLPDLPTLRARSRDALRNDPVAVGAVETLTAAVVGTGLVPRPMIDRDALDITDEQASAIERAMQRYFYAWAESTACDLRRRLTFAAMTRAVFRDVCADGDKIAVRRFRQHPDSPFALRIQLVDADRLSNPHDGPDSARLRSGVEFGADGEAVRYWISSEHPAEQRVFLSSGARTWDAVPARGPESGMPLVLHVFDPTRADITRGVPLLAAVLAPLKQITRLSDAELMAAVVQSLLTVFLEDENSADPAGPMFAPPTDNDVAHYGPLPTREVKMGHGSVIGLNRGQKATLVDPKRPNGAFDPFFGAIVRQIGAAIGVPAEIIMKQFVASYSAARAAFLEFWRTVRVKRSVLIEGWARPVWEWLLTECVARGYLDLPGFLDDPMRRRAWAFCEWSGPVMGQIDPQSEVEAAAARVREGFSNLQRETAELTGEDWEAVHAQRVKEVRMRQRDGLDREPVAERVELTATERDPESGAERRKRRSGDKDEGDGEGNDGEQQTPDDAGDGA